MTKREITPRQAAAKLGIRLDGVYGRLWAGRLRARKVDGRWLILEADILQQARRRSGTARKLSPEKEKKTNADNRKSTH